MNRGKTKHNMADLTLARRNELEEFKCPAVEAIKFKLVRKDEDIDDETKCFPPDMTHQIFGESEMIFGYKGLRVSIYYTAVKLLSYFNISHTEICSTERHGVPPDDVHKLMSADLPPGHLTNLDSFRAALEQEKTFKPFGQQIDSYTLPAKVGERQFEVYHNTIEEPGFRDYHGRLESFIKYYIDAASYIDVDDPLWDYFVLYEKYKDEGEWRYAVAGYMTTYNFYAYPCRVRPRISQVLVLPPFQKMGLGARLLQTFYNVCYSRAEVLDIAVEDPSDSFQRVRDFVDARNCEKLESFQPKELHNGFSHEMVHEAQTKLRLSKIQTRRVYEILRLKHTDESNKEMFRAFRLDVKRRLNLPFLRNRRLYQKLEKSLNAEELTQTLGIMKPEQKFQFLESSFQEDLTTYRHVVERMAAS